jgi:hypothetical protein
MHPLTPRTALAGPTLEQRLAKLESVIKVETDGSVTIHCTRITIKADTSVDIASGTNMVVKGQMTVRVETGANLSLRAGADLDLLAAAALNLRSSGEANLRGSVVKLNGGSQPVARLGETVVSGIIQGGNNTVLG